MSFSQGVTGTCYLIGINWFWYMTILRRCGLMVAFIYVWNDKQEISHQQSSHLVPWLNYLFSQWEEIKWPS